ncbi:hypothetical protein [Nannocystis pusilla]|uniref:hypothetical protein n=1 Tax=Nannocystis pusilla TaxID=889268 RepID=UPI003DA649B9
MSFGFEHWAENFTLASQLALQSASTFGGVTWPSHLGACQVPWHDAWHVASHWPVQVPSHLPAQRPWASLTAQLPLHWPAQRPSHWPLHVPWQRPDSLAGVHWATISPGSTLTLQRPSQRARADASTLHFGGV